MFKQADVYALTVAFNGGRNFEFQAIMARLLPYYHISPTLPRIGVGGVATYGEISDYLYAQHAAFGTRNPLGIVGSATSTHYSDGSPRPFDPRFRR